MRVSLIVLLAVLLVIGISACALIQHPVQPLAANYHSPNTPKPECVLTGDQVRIDGQTLVRWRCADGYRLTDKRTGKVEAFVSWQEIDK